MKYIKLKCNTYDCEAEFFIVLNDWYNKEFDGKIQDFYICNSLVHTDKNDCIFEM